MDKDRRTRVKTYTQFLECPLCFSHPCCETHCFIRKDEFEEVIGSHDMNTIFESHGMSRRNNGIFLPWNVPSKTLACGLASSVCLEEWKKSVPAAPMINRAIWKIKHKLPSRKGKEWATDRSVQVMLYRRNDRRWWHPDQPKRPRRGPERCQRSHPIPICCFAAKTS